MNNFMSHPDPLILRIFQLYLFAASTNLAVSEYKGDNLQYSKFVRPFKGRQRRFSSRIGMIVIYTPALVLSSAFLLYKLGFLKILDQLSFIFDFPNLSSLVRSHGASTRLLLFASAVMLHFLKRDLEVLFVHKYSGSMLQGLGCLISASYAFASAGLLYAQQVSERQQPPSIDLMWWGVPIFFVGLLGNLYHHHLLACLRKPQRNNDQKYVVPEGGLFAFVVCPHYLFEIIEFFGLAFIGQTASAFVYACSVALGLGSRSRSTRLWYLKKIEAFPKDRKALIPFIY